MQQPLIFHWRPASSPMPKGAALFFALFALAALGIVVWLSPLTWASVSAIDWPGVWQKATLTPGKFVPLMVYSVVAVVVLGARHLHKSRARLILDEHALRYSSGMPILQRWMDWRLDLEAVRSQRVLLRLAVNLSGVQSLQLYALTWGAVNSKRTVGPHLRPASWYLPGQPTDARPALFGDIVLWPSEKSRAALQQRFLALPLVQALSQRGIVLPPVTAKAPTVGIDLMAHASMRVAVYLFFGLLLLALVLLLLMRNTYYFSAPLLSTWLTVAGIAGLCMLVWMWGDGVTSDAGQTAATLAAPSVGHRATQTVLAVLVGIAAGLCAPSLPLAFSSLTQASEAQVFALRKLPLELVSQHADGMPSIQHLKADEYWQSLPEGEAVTLPIRRGAWGLWWQFDASAVREKWKAYYDAHPL